MDRLLASLVVVASFGIAPQARPVVYSTEQHVDAFDLWGTVRDPIRAAVVKSFGLCSSKDLIWDELNQTWAEYGPIPISVDYSNPALCKGRITYQALVQSNADVIILSDPSGGGLQYSAAEVRALLRYASRGHILIGTYLTFGGEVINNSLAALFGLNPDAGYIDSGDVIEPTYYLTVTALRLFRNIGNPYVSQGFPRAEHPWDFVWDENELQGARYVAHTTDSFGAISLYEPGPYDAIYITNMPEYQGGTADLQFFYNAITFDATRLSRRNNSGSLDSYRPPECMARRESGASRTCQMRHRVVRRGHFR